MPVARNDSFVHEFGDMRTASRTRLFNAVTERALERANAIMRSVLHNLTAPTNSSSSSSDGGGGAGPSSTPSSGKGGGSWRDGGGNTGWGYADLNAVGQAVTDFTSDTAHYTEG